MSWSSLSHATHIANKKAAIRSVFVHPAWARRGLARYLIQRSEGEIQAAGYEVAELTATLAGVPLYETLGYRTTAHVPTTLPDGVEVLLISMRKQLISAFVLGPPAAGGMILD